MKRFYKAVALVSLLGLGISNLLCGELGDENIDQATDSQENPTREEVDQLFNAIEEGNDGEVRNIFTMPNGEKTQSEFSSDSARLEDNESEGSTANLYINAPLANARDNNAYTPLHRAALGGRVEIVKVLLVAGAEVNAKNNHGWTVLHAAVLGGHAKVVEVLLAAGANKDAKDNYGCTPLHSAALGGHTEIVEMLLVAGANKDAKDGRGLIPRDFAHTKSIEKLLAY